MTFHSAREAADAALLARAPTLLAYVQRVGAVQKSFRKFIVEADGEATYHGMRREVARITVNKETNSVECNVKDYAPTEAEAAAVKLELAAIETWPTSIPATKTQVKALQAQLGCDDGHFYAFRQQRGDDYIFVQQRVYNAAGKKSDIPFTMWPDGEWRCMEPEGLLPLYGLDQLASGKSAMIHEGAKAAKKIRAMCDDETPEGKAKLAAHPWGAELKRYVHLGWPGGANNPHRVDWGPIKELASDVRVVLISDHDQVGENAVTTISCILRRRMDAIRFDDRFPHAFDLADPWPTLVDGHRYIGPTFADCLVPATWATDQVPSNAKGGRPSFKVRDQFAAEWWFVIDPPVFVLRTQPSKLLNEKSFNRGGRPFSDAEDTARLLVKKFSSQCKAVVYDPGERSGVIHREGQRLINTYQPSLIKAISGDAKMFTDFMNYLVPDEGDRQALLKWCATLIARPDIRPSYGVLMISQTQGVGKGTLGEAILAPLLGIWNVSFPSEQQVTESSFNSWLAHKRLAVIHEIYAGHSAKAYDRLKKEITDRYVDVNEKFMPTYRLDNFITIYACSNSLRALKLDDADRRWLVPRITEIPKSDIYWKDFYKWLRDEGLGIIKYWAKQFIRDNGPVSQGEHAPSTSLKKELIAEGRSEGQRLAYDLGVQVCALGKKEPPTKIVLVVEDVRDWVASKRRLDHNDQRLEKSLTLRNMLKAAGLAPPARKPGEDHRRFTIKEGRVSHVMANFAIGTEEKWADLKAFHTQPDATEIWSM